MCDPSGPPYSCSANGVPSFITYFKILSIGPVPGIETATSPSAQRCTDRVIGSWLRLRLNCPELEGSLSCGGFVYTWKYVTAGSSAWYA